MSRFGTIDTQFFDDSGAPLVNGLINFYQTGTTTRKTTYADSSLTIPNSNPVVLTADGRLDVDVYFDGVCDASVTTSAGVVVGKALHTNIGGGASSAFSDWTATASYDSGDIVIGPDGGYYSSLSSGNQGNDPTSSAVYWREIVPPTVWNANVTYAVNNLVQGSDGELYISLVASNLANDPTTDASGKWAKPNKISSILTGGGALSVNKLNQLTDSSTYDLPAAGDYPAGFYIDVEKDDEFKASTPSVQIKPASGDTIRLSTGTDTSIVFNLPAAERWRFTSNGTSEWGLS